MRKVSKCLGMISDLIIGRMVSSCISGKALFKFLRNMTMVIISYKICQVRYITLGSMDGASGNTFRGLKLVLMKGSQKKGSSRLITDMI